MRLTRNAELFTLLAFCHAVYAALYTDSDHLPATIFDFVIVGGGTAGCVVASRLMENPDVSVLVVEAGISNNGILGIQIPFLASQNLGNASFLWNFVTAPQPGLDNRTVSYARGRILGGSSSVNYLVYTRGAGQEYDKWAEITGDQGWSWDNLSKYYLKSSRLVPPADHHNTTGQVEPSAHGFGPVEVSVSGFPTEIDGRVVNTSKIPGSEFPFNADLNFGDYLGVSYLQATVGRGQRSSAATAYLDPVLSRKNLHVLINNTVTRLISSGSSYGKPSFKAAEFAPDASGAGLPLSAGLVLTLQPAKRGYIGTPQILMLSGVGDREVLTAAGIKPVVDLPDVGQHLRDQPRVENYWTVASNMTSDTISRNPDIFNADHTLWKKNHSGQFAASTANTTGFFRIPNDDPIWNNVSDPELDPNIAHFELIFDDGFSPTVDPLPPTGNYLSINTVLVSPTSVGSVRLASSDPFASPLINPGFLTTEFDNFALLAATKAARRFVEARFWEGFIIERFGSMGSAESDEEILAAIRQAVVTIYHAACTARMLPANASWGVVDLQLRAKGVSGLRVVDASVMPVIPAEHPVAAVYVVAERAADLIKGSWS
ncbi:uncharacterized protein PHACADRAFT_100299 [Phanerochaete carnosa HHB-10118-sp]|uniref:Glucose-methanol-choline oxidoreductase N-terminal domain-containing protein n=1 Tax=Phanerochaete carnosa (strain HHB-10118-sp) TaxID=650164 RepID=K5VZG7_PHACS|nr:uncharacterized protein PHACADRAFT_100299 [Phanerochaete carnosa HHB-10118-sp]EKM52230.1 hypothetical protein PHACADRAFT_100299 [Phanerochaete carnosa HHB-10118-sp]